MLQYSGYVFLLLTKTQTKRRLNKFKEVMCKNNCGFFKSLLYMLQGCHLTYDARCARPNQVCSLFVARLRKFGFFVLRSPTSKQKTCFCKPDIIRIKKTFVFVIDICICFDARLGATWKLKI